MIFLSILIHIIFLRQTGVLRHKPLLTVQYWQ
jgi:hypothetical protein